MSMSWFRMYNSFLHEPNVQRLPPLEFKIYVNCLCIASAHDPRGSLPSLENLAFLLKVSEKKADKFLNFLKNSELFDEKNGFIFIKEWDKKQFESDNVTVRTQRHRERMERSRNVAGNVGGNVSGTPPDTETETETDTELKNPPISPQGGKVLSQPSLLVDSEPQRPSVAVPKKNGHAHDEAFARFWEAYPRKVGKHAARQVFDKINLDPETSDRIVAAADAYRKKVARDGTDPQYIKHPSGWLNARRWEDEPEPEKYTLHHIPTNNSAFANFAF